MSELENQMKFEMELRGYFNMCIKFRVKFSARETGISFKSHSMWYAASSYRLFQKLSSF